VVGEGSNGVLRLEEETGDEGRSMAEGDNGRGWELMEGGNRRRQRIHFWRCRRASGFQPWTGGRGQSGTRSVLVKEEERGEKGVGDIDGAF
jgi:hypothetical protein